MAELGTRSELSQQTLSAAARSWADCCPNPSPPHLEVVLHVAVGVLGGVQEDEQVLAQVIGHGVQPGQGRGRQGELQDLCGRRPGGLDKLHTGGFKTQLGLAGCPGALILIQMMPVGSARGECGGHNPRQCPETDHRISRTRRDPQRYQSPAPGPAQDSPKREADIHSKVWEGGHREVLLCC